MQEELPTTEKTRPSTQSGQFIDTLIEQWTKRTGADIALHQTEEQVAEASTSQNSRQLSQNQERYIQVLIRKLKQSQQKEASLSSDLEMEMRNKEEIQTKLNATWESIDTISEYYNFISESFTSFQQHINNLSNLYDNVILKQQEGIQKLQLSNAQLKDMEKNFTQLENEVMLRDRRLQEAAEEQNKLRKQLEDFVHELQSQKNSLTNAHAEEKSTLVKEQQRLLLEYENLQLRLKTVENEKCDVTKSAAQLQNKLTLQEEKVHVALTEKDKLQRQLEDSNKEIYVQKNKLVNAHAEEKSKLVKEQQRLLLENENLQLRLQTVENEKCDVTKSAAQLQKKLALQEEKVHVALTEKDKLQKQLEDVNNKFYVQKNKLASAHAEEKSTLVKEQQRLLLEYENLQLRLQTVENEKCDVTKSAAQLQNKLALQEEKVHVALTEKDKLQRQLEDSNNEFYVQKNKLASAHAKEKRKFVEEQQRLSTECESLQSQLDILQQDKSNIAETVDQKDALVSKLLSENSAYKNQIKDMMASAKEMSNKYEALEEKQNMWEKELRAKIEKVQNLEATLNATKRRETSLINDVNRMKQKIADEMNYFKNLESKLSDTRKDLQNAEMQNIEIQEVVKHTRAAKELADNELANLNRELKTLQQKKEEAAKREITSIKNADILYENTRAKHAEEVLALTSSYETRLLELRKTIDSLNEANNNALQENSALKTSLTEMRKEHISLKSDYQLAMERNKNLHDKLKETFQTKSADTETSQRSYLKDKTQSTEKREYKVSTSANIRSRISDLGDNEHVRSLSQQLDHTYPIKRESQKEQEEEVTSAGKKFFKSRPVQPRTYSKRQ